MTLIFSLLMFAQAASDTATFAGGCFWCVHAIYDGVEGVTSVASGYTGGEQADPTYEEVSSGRTGHVEAVQVLFDPKKISYERLLELFWANIDPLDSEGQFCDKGSQYHSVIFYHTAEQKRLAEESKRRIEARLEKSVPTLITEAAPFYPAEEYHQEYHRKNPLQYRSYKALCGREERLRQLWSRGR